MPLIRIFPLQWGIEFHIHEEKQINLEFRKFLSAGFSI